jgi:hypothetical protein
MAIRLCTGARPIVRSEQKDNKKRFDTYPTILTVDASVKWNSKRVSIFYFGIILGFFITESTTLFKTFGTRLGAFLRTDSAVARFGGNNHRDHTNRDNNVIVHSSI